MIKQRARKQARTQFEELPRPQEELTPDQAETVRGRAGSVKTFGIGKLPPVVTQADYMPSETLTQEERL